MDKFDHVIYLFTMIKKKPGLYIGSKSLVRLKSFIDGYIFALKIKGNDYQTEQYKKFNKWIEKNIILAGIYTENGVSRLFAVCIRYAEIDGLKVLPKGTYLCANCTEENREQVLNEAVRIARTKYGVAPTFTVQLIVVSGILHWNYQVQILLSANQE